MGNKFKRGNTHAKGRIPWNKGLTKENEKVAKSIEKMNKARKKLYKEGKLNVGRKIFLTKEELYDLYWNKGLTTREIAEKFNANKTTLHSWLKKYDIPRKSIGKPRKVNISKEELYDLYYKKDMTIRQIANKINVSISSICRWMKIYKIPSKPTSHWMSGEKNSSWKGGLTKVICKNCEKEFERPKCHVKYNEAFCSNKCKYDYRVGENASNWKGGISFEPYAPEFNKKLKRQIRERDNHTCQECGKTKEELGKNPSIHHIDYNKKNNNHSNLICLCDTCHGKTTYDRKDWTRYFKEKLLNETD